MTMPTELYVHTRVAVTQDASGAYAVEVRLELPDGTREVVDAGAFKTLADAVAFANILHEQCCAFERANKERSS